MAGTMTHTFFAEDVYKNLDNKKYINIENLKTYAQGHDIFFFTFNILNYKTKKIGNFMHRNKTKDFFINIISYIKDNNLQNNKDVMSFLYGYICHYCLDLTVHPYVTYKCGIFNKKKKETYKYNSKHSDFETYIDAYMIKERKKINPNKFKCYKHCFNTKVSKDLSKLIDYVYKKTYDFNNMSILYKEGIFNMKVSYRILRYDPIKIKMKIYKLIDKISPKSIKKLYPISYSYELNNNEYYLNLNNNTWNHPRYKNETYMYSFIDLYNNALNLALNIIKNVDNVLYNKKDIELLNNVFLNISMSSGKECNDKTKNKYFEY